MKAYIPASWFHPIGIKKVVSKLLPKLPDVSDCLFITLTLDRNQFSGPASAYEYSRDKIRRLFYSIRRGIKWNGKFIKINVPYCTKLEFHEDGWPHYHIIFLTKKRIPAALLRELWPYGRTNIKRINNKKFHYLLKYVTKGADVPEWILGYKRIRIFQSSRGFYLKTPETKEEKQPERPKKERGKQTSTIGQRLRSWEYMALIETRFGEMKTAILPIPYSEFLSRHVTSIAQAGCYLGNGLIKLNYDTVMLWKKEIRKTKMEYTFVDWLYPAPRALLNVRTAQAARLWSPMKSAHNRV